MVDKYAQAYQEEAREVLLDLESALLELNESREDSELVGRVFRALHTIKGSGSMFGFDRIAAFTHHVETVFDEVRNGRLRTTADLISVTLAAVDQIKAMLAESAGQGKADSAQSVQILEQLRALTGKPEIPVAEVSCPTPVVPDQPPASDAPGNWRIRFHPGPDLLTRGANPLLLFRELRELGLLDIKADTSEIPPLDELDPERCYISWEMILTTGVPLEAIRDVFIFVEDSCELVIEPVPASAQASAAVGSEPARQGTEIEPRVGIEKVTSIERHPGEERQDPAKDPQSSTIRVPAVKLDRLVDLVGQLVTVQARLTEIAARSEDRDMQAVVEAIESLSAELRDNSMSLRTVPLKSTFERFKRLVYDLGRTLHKNVELTFDGENTDLDKTVIDQLGDPLMHLIRNSMDHGIEMSDARCSAGKPPSARIHLSAHHSGAQVLISISDDGGGIDAEAVRVRAVEKGLIAADTRLSESEVFSLILMPGFSTAREITDVSGRGVGMDVVRRSVDALRGSIDIASKLGQGTTVTLRLPLTLAIIDGLLVRVGQTHFVMPLANTVECVELTQRDIDLAGDKHLANIRGEVVPYIRLSEYMHMDSERPKIEQIMVAETEQGRFGFVVDQVLGHHQTVIKNLGRLYRNVPFISGATILGNGTLALILDLDRLMQDALHTNDQVTRILQQELIRKSH